jgi:hypothetical protein
MIDIHILCFPCGSNKRKIVGVCVHVHVCVYARMNVLVCVTSQSRVLLENLLKKVLVLLCYPKLRYCVYNCCQPIHVLSDTNPFHVFHPV